MQQYEHWANMLYPKLTFKDVTDRIEALASKKDFKVKRKLSKWGPSLNYCAIIIIPQSQLYQMRRRAARGGRDTPPLHSDDSDQEQGSGPHANDSTNQHPPHDPENGAPRDNETTQEPSAGGGFAQIHDDTVVVGGANGSDVITNGEHDAVGGASRYSNTALNRLTMDAYGSSDEDD